MSDIMNVAILIYDDVELLDFCGPFEVFSVVNRTNDSEYFNVYPLIFLEKSVRILKLLKTKDM